MTRCLIKSQVLLCALLLTVLTVCANAEAMSPKNLLPPVTSFTLQPNGGAETVPHWQFTLFDPAQGQAVAEGAALKFHVTQMNGKFWHAQLKYPVQIPAGQSYEVKFHVRSDASVTLTDTGEGFPENYTAEHQLLKAGPEWKTFTFRFIASEAVETRTLLPVYFCGQQPSTVWIENVVLRTLPSGSSLTLPVTDTAAWLVSQWGKDASGTFHFGLGQTAAMSAEGGAAKFILAGQPGEWTSWQTYTSLCENTAYTLRFRARADHARDMTVWGELDTMPTPANGLAYTAHLTSDWQSYQTTFTTKQGMTGLHQTPEFVVSGPAGTIWLKAVSLLSGQAPVLPLEAPAPPPDAPTPPAGPMPRAGETRFVGTVMSINPAARSLLLAVTAFTLPDGTSTVLPAPRPKTIHILAVTLLVTPDLTQKTLADLKEGDALTVIGKDAGVGKSVSARTVIMP